MNTYESIETRLTNGGTQRLTCLVMHPPRRKKLLSTLLGGRSTAKPHGLTESGAPGKRPVSPAQPGEAPHSVPTGIFWGIIGYAAGVITYCWIHILTTVN